MSDKTKKCKIIYNWQLNRLTRNVKNSKNKIDKISSEIALKMLKTKKGKKFHFKNCVGPDGQIFSKIKDENDYNEKMDKYHKLFDEEMNKIVKGKKPNNKTLKKKIKNIFK